MDITENDLNELALRVVEVCARRPPIVGPRIRIISRDDDEAAYEEAGKRHDALNKWYQPLADKYDLDVSTVIVIFQQTAVEWVNAVLDGSDDQGTFYDYFHSFIHSMENMEDEEDNGDFSDVDVDSLMHEILVMMENNVDAPPPAGTRSQ